MSLLINLALENPKTLSIPYTYSTIADEVCSAVCIHLNIGPSARHIFALRGSNKNFHQPTATFRDSTTFLEFRVRYKVASLAKLKKLDSNAFEYYYHQTRIDVIECNVPDIVYEKHRAELLGLAITDMFRVVMEKEVSVEAVEQDYRKFVPKVLLKKHRFFVKKPIRKNLANLFKAVKDKPFSADFLKSQYLGEVDLIAPEYLSETFRALIDVDGRSCFIVVKVTPPHVPNSGVKYCWESKRNPQNWTHMCTIEELGFITTRDDASIEISRLNGIPIYIKFHKLSDMWSFVSLLNGYYRLTCKWTFALCQSLITPSMKRLHSMRCHGPVGGEFSYAKLEIKTNNQAGCYIIRESETSFNSYYIDVCVKDRLSSTPKTFKLTRLQNNQYIFNDDLEPYNTLDELVEAYSQPEGAIYLKECIYPSEYDVSPLLLCRKENVAGEALTESSLLPELNLKNPVCINFKDLQVYKEMPPGNLTDLTQCKVSLLGVEYLGNIASTESNVRCQNWNSDSPHKVDPNLTDDKFPLSSKEDSKNYCRNPDRKLTGLWCYTMNDDLIDDTCAVPLCSFSQCRITGNGMEYGGVHDRGVSDRKCLKWDKKRTKVFFNGDYIMYPKFPATHFPDGSISKAKKYCRNPDADSGGPWCFVENQEGGYMEREYCDIPFCYDPECSVFTKNSKTYMHYTDFNGTVLTDIKFSIKLWNSDDFNEASARLVLSVLALPLTGQEIEDLGVGIEIFISNKESALRFGNKDKPEFESTPGILTSTNFTTFTLNWHRGFITLGIEGRKKPIFLSEIKTKGNLMGMDKDRFNFYSVQGTNVLWSFPFCLEDDECDVHTTTGGEFQQFWPLRQKDIVFDLYIHLRAFYSASVLFTPAPTIEYPNLRITFAGLNGLTRVVVREYLGGKEVVLLQLKLEDIIDYWEWREFSISLFANSLQIYMKKPIGMHSLLEATREVFRVMRWFSVSSENSVAHWSFYCQPPHFAQPPPALLPECAINSKEAEYTGTQDVTSGGLPCLPWSGRKMIPKDVLSKMFSNKTLMLESRNYCRDPEKSGNGTFCFALDQYQKQVRKQFCQLRKCKSQLCKMAGTGNDFIGQLTVTRSGRECDFWDATNSSVHQHFIYNNTYFPDLNSTQARNFCRNPNRDISGSWCFTKDPQVVQDVCRVRDCDRPEELTIIVSTNTTGRRVYVLPQWREEGLHGGLRFSLKGWNPDVPTGIIFATFPKEGSGEMVLIIGAHFNEKVELYVDKELVDSKIFPHLISSGVWTDFWLQMRKGEMLLGFRGVSTPFFKWTNPNMSKAFEPAFISYHSPFYLSPIGVFFHQKDECHTENTTDNDFLKYIPIGLYSDLERAQHTNLTLMVRGVGEARVSFMSLISNISWYQIKIDSISGIIGLHFLENLTKSSEPQITSLIEKQLPHTMAPKNWTKIYFFWTERIFDIELNGQLVLRYESFKPILVYWFSVAAVRGWITWSANCEPLDLDGPPIDGGWSSWSPWTCTVSCGGGEGFRTRTCSNPHPNVLGKLCEGNPTATGVCNDFPCGDINPDTIEQIRENLRKKAYSFVIDEGSPILLMNDREMWEKVKKQSPEAYFEWTLNGIFLNVSERVAMQGDDILIYLTKPSDSGVYVSMIHRLNEHKVILKIISLAIRSKGFNVDTRATRAYNLECHSVVLGYAYSSLSLKITFNNQTYIDHGLSSLAIVSTQILSPLNESNSGTWQCVVEQKDLGLRWVTNYVKINVKKRPNFFTNLMEDRLTSPLFGRMKSEEAVLVTILLIIVVVLGSVIGFLYVYFKFRITNPPPSKKIGQRKDGLRNITHVYRGMWKVTRDKKIEIALKFLKQDQEKHLKSYLSLTGQWTFVKSPFIVRFYGIALQSNDVSIVMEYFKLGPLDQYLRHNQSIIKTVDLIEATSHLASAVWHLRENDIIHGRIRCRKLMVHAHDDSCFMVKLTDNAVQTCYEASEVHWIAVECYTSEKRTAAADVWAMATTIYEMFTYGRELPTGDYAKMMNRYLNGDRLLRPAGCPEEIYTLLTECWDANPKTRKQSQEVSREVNHLLYQVYNSRKNHAYDIVGRTATNHNLSSSNHKLSDLVSASDLNDTSTARHAGSLFSGSSQQWVLNSDGCEESRDLSHLLSNLTVSTIARSEDSLTSVQSIFELDDSHAVVLKGCIGQGNFGQVFKGILESYSDNSYEPIMVAVKKVKGSTLSSVEDFEREINIMKGLKHPNIVHILGVLRDPDLQLVMEYVPDGCLQAHLKHKKDELQIPLLLKYASDIAQGMDYLGTKNIVHRDLAARNILVVERSHVKISDFGLAQFIGSDDYYTVRNRNRELPLKWYAPESFGFEGKFSVRSDVWSYGVTLYEMFAYGDSPPELGNLDSAPEGQEQASLQKSMLDAIYRGARYPCPEHCPQTVYFNVIKPCWELDPHARPAFKDLIAEVDKLKSHY